MADGAETERVETERVGTEDRPGVGRVEAFSDGVVAIIITIMVLDLHPPVSESMDRLWTLWPIFLAYLLSYVYVAIYWVNHHRLFGHATRVTNALLWSNMLLLLALSLVPFSTAYLGEHHFGPGATRLYLATLILPAAAYTWLAAIIARTGERGPAAHRYHARSRRKGMAAVLVYGLGIALSFVTSWLGVACAAMVALVWFLPAGPFDRLFAVEAGQRQPDGGTTRP